MPLEANLHEEVEETDMVATLFKNVDKEDLVSSNMIYLMFVAASPTASTKTAFRRNNLDLDLFHFKRYAVISVAFQGDHSTPPPK